MSHLNLTPALYEYILDVSVNEHPVLRTLREETAKMPLGVMQISPELGQFMQLLVRLIDAKKILEIGTFTGYSALTLALALPEDGHLITCDINAEWTSKAPVYWEQAKQANKIELRLAPALNTLQQLLEEGFSHSFDLIFIDADKTNYVNYYELGLQLIRPRGLIIIDNVLWGGKVIDEQETGGQTREIRRLNALLKQDDRVYTSLLPVRDGIFLVQLKSDNVQR
ncbi:class I SAM-dependent methyltransferase [Legionella oakridgensis]|uniref:O-methyltransferase n=2 Tax=Legionella oakridgensis TaxID=29423 RepID=A0A0W0XG49_9GAMM|nr:class I SAM-dependent methyltransferase [Legionella oakridgensis]AHE67375.1 putative O-methyltransferase [Legionella oakridgensis ATCC 33761 = DSM 21215]ETO93036.1 putative O-methyltransferase [Legionella oakridgensis RV-2-2007]KTD43444.1 O-methyltransferase [Legionella oakridgensis]STY20435.1 O-methyltransferase [Legionella longbeachae]